MDEKKPIVHLNEEETALLDSLDRGEWKSVHDLELEKTKARHAARRYLHKRERVNIRVSESDLTLIKQKAAFEGLPYQTLIASILHKYASGRLT